MPQFRFVPAAFAASTVLFVSSFAGAVVAPGYPGPVPGCGSGPVCAYGFECTQVAAASCPPSASCPAGQECPPPAPCTTTVEYGCVPAHCSADSQCASDMVCHAWTEPCVVTDCACPANTPSCNCGAPVCDPQTVSICTPRYDLPCKVAADCGAGFTCEEAQSCGCASSGGSATPTPSGGASYGAAPAPSYPGGFPNYAGTSNTGNTGNLPVPPGGAGGAGGAAADPVPTPPDCSCQPSGQMQCVPMDIACQTAAQCPAGWTCQAENVATGAAACPPGAPCLPLPAPPPPVSKCMPPYFGAKSGGDLEVPSTPTTGTGTTGTGTTGTGTGTAGTGPTGIPNEGTPPNKGTPEPTTSAQSHDVSACAMGHAPASSGALALLAMLGALFGLKRRRA